MWKARQIFPTSWIYRKTDTAKPAAELKFGSLFALKHELTLYHVRFWQISSRIFISIFFHIHKAALITSGLCNIIFVKGQLISKCLFNIFNSPKKRTKKFDLKTPKRQFEINWPLLWLVFILQFFFWEEKFSALPSKNKVVDEKKLVQSGKFSSTNLFPDGSTLNFFLSKKNLSNESRTK